MMLQLLNKSLCGNKYGNRYGKRWYQLHISLKLKTIWQKCNKDMFRMLTICLQCFWTHLSKDQFRKIAIMATKMAMLIPFFFSAVPIPWHTFNANLRKIYQFLKKLGKFVKSWQQKNCHHGSEKWQYRSQNLISPWPSDYTSVMWIWAKSVQ